MFLSLLPKVNILCFDLPFGTEAVDLFASISRGSLQALNAIVTPTINFCLFAPSRKESANSLDGAKGSCSMTRHVHRSFCSSCALKGIGSVKNPRAEPIGEPLGSFPKFRLWRHEKWTWTGENMERSQAMLYRFSVNGGGLEHSALEEFSWNHEDLTALSWNSWQEVWEKFGKKNPTFIRFHDSVFSAFKVPLMFMNIPWRSALWKLSIFTKLLILTLIISSKNICVKISCLCVAKQCIPNQISYFLLRKKVAGRSIWHKMSDEQGKWLQNAMIELR